jgi:hypothetical protein
VYERRAEKLLPLPAFTRRVVAHVSFSVAAAVVALFIGVAGYHYIAGLPWIDSLLNASMILGGMGQVNSLHADGAKLFASAYALFSGLVFIGVSGLLLAPFLHRMFHWFHIDE